MKKSHFLIATLCASALVLSACTLGGTTKKKKKKSSSASITSVEPGTSSGGQPTSGGGQTSVTPGSSATPGSSGTPTPSTSTPTPKTLDSISVTTQPTKTEYKAGEQFDPSGMVVTASYSDGSTANVTSQCTFSPTTLTEGVTSVTVSFGGKTTSVAVTVSPAPTWSAAEKAIFASNLYGYEIPYFAEHHSEMQLVGLTGGNGVQYYGGTSSQALIQEYSALVPAAFGMKRSSNTKIFAYYGETEITVESKTRNIAIAVFGRDGSSISSDGSGTFTVQAYDPYDYEWSDINTNLDLIASIFASIGTAEWREGDLNRVTIPEFSGDNVYYQLDIDSFVESDFYAYQISEELGCFPIADAYAVLNVFCTQEQFTDYLDSFEDEESGYKDDWKYGGAYQGDYCPMYVYNSTHGNVSIEMGFVSGANIAIMYVEPTSFSEFPNEQVENYIALDRENPQQFPIPNFGFGEDDQFTYYVNDFDGSMYVNLYVYDNDSFTQKSVDDYVEGLDPTKFSYEKIVEESSSEEDEEETRADSEEETSYYYYVEDLEYKYTFFVEYIETTFEDGTVEKEVEWQVQYELEHLADFPASDVDSFYSDAKITAPATPSYVAEEQGHYFQKVVSESGVDIGVYKTTEIEMLAYISALAGVGYVGELDTDSKPVFVDGEYVMEVASDETHAKVTIINSIEKGGYVELYFELGYVDWSDNDKKFFDQYLGGIYPPYFKGGIDYSYFQQAQVISSNNTFDDAAFGDYVTLAKSEGWAEKQVQSTSGTMTIYEKLGLYGRAYFYRGSDKYLYFDYEQTSYTPAELAQVKACLHDVVPPFLCGVYKYDETTQTIQGSLIYKSVDTDYEDALVKDGWKKETTESGYFYWKASADGEGYAKFYWQDYTQSGTTYKWPQWAYVNGATPGGDVPPTPVESSVKYTFTNTNSGTEVTDLATIFGWFSDPEMDIFTAATASSKVYPGANGGSGDNKWDVQNALKIGSSTAGGSLTLTVAEGVSIEKIVIEGYGWKNSSSKALVITVGGVASASDPLPYTTTISGGGEAGTVEFSFDTPVTGSLVISTGETAVIITSITVYYSVAN